ncbi:hypothetical protein E3P77_01376 [Wallemia ichthyophaga]|nr:hypothetical protein E3P98_01562 [Wallemia ichthyophaga]TIB04176.1 hypothetical protein E3P94_00663 [Wallemia ichthyophaga]TIB67675.1 hypothetical protein E3P77_01376 [Wallemia ichthyophaga]
MAILTIVGALIIILVTLYLFKYDAPPLQPASIIVAPSEDDEIVVNDDDDGWMDSGIHVTHTDHSETLNMRPLSNIPKSANNNNPHNIRSSWIEICNPKHTHPTTHSSKLRGLPSSPRPPSFYPLNLPSSNNFTLTGLPTSVRPLSPSPVIDENAPLATTQDDSAAQRFIDRRSKILSYTQHNRSSFVAGDDIKLR